MRVLPSSHGERHPSASTASLAKAMLESLRPRQWVKNVFVAAPLVFAKHLGNSHELARVFAAFVVFCAISSAVYLGNDLLDVEKDRHHPNKRKRPIASGRLPEANARAAIVGLVLAGLVSALWLEPRFFTCALAYLVLNAAYSFRLKNVVYVDVLCIATGFLLRVLGGAVVIQVTVTHYLLLCTGLLACFLGFGMRAHELAEIRPGSIEQRPVLGRYDARVLSWASIISGALTFAAYVAYTRAPHTIEFFGTTHMIWTAPFALLGLARFGWLVYAKPSAYPPTEEMVRDVPFMLNLFVWVAAVVAIIYLR